MANEIVTKEKSDFIKHIGAGYPLLWIDTLEYTRVVKSCIRELQDFAQEKSCVVWDCDRGIWQYTNPSYDEDFEIIGEQSEMMPNTPKDALDFLVSENNEHYIMFCMDFHKFIEDINIERALLNAIPILKENRNTLVIVSPIVKIPPEINRYVTILDFNLPTQEEIKDFINEFTDSFGFERLEEDKANEIAKSGLGLTIFELENALSMSISQRKGKLSADFVNEQKKQLIKANGSLKINQSDLTFDSLYGLDTLKDFAKRMVGKGKGILLVGVPGGGKSHFANTLGTETNRITINLDFGNLMGSLVGETEQKTTEALKTIDALEPCILFIDEIEKGLAGVSGFNGDSGTSRRQGGQFLKWLSDHKTDVYVIATSNDISQLPPEYLRAERWDAIFFVDLPTEEERNGISQLYAKEYNITDTDVPCIENWTGAEIKSLYRLANNLDCSLKEASQYVCPLYKTMDGKIKDLRNWAKNRCVNASKIATNNSTPKKSTKGKGKRNIVIDD